MGLRLSRTEQLLQRLEPDGLNRPHLPPCERKSDAFFGVGRLIHKHRDLLFNPQLSAIGSIRSAEHGLGWSDGLPVTPLQFGMNKGLRLTIA